MPDLFLIDALIAAAFLIIAGLTVWAIYDAVRTALPGIRTLRSRMYQPFVVTWQTKGLG